MSPVSLLWAYYMSLIDVSGVIVLFGDCSGWELIRTRGSASLLVFVVFVGSRGLLWFGGSLALLLLHMTKHVRSWWVGVIGLDLSVRAR